MPQRKVKDKKISESQMVELQEMHCQGCGRFLGFQAIIWGVIKIRCTNSKCREWNTFDINPEHKI